MSEQRRYTAQEMREAAKSLTYGDDESALEFVVAEVGDNLTLKESADETNAISAMLRQSADAEEELEQLKARLSDVVKECENKRQKISEVKDIDAPLAYDLGLQVDAILRAARGE